MPDRPHDKIEQQAQTSQHGDSGTLNFTDIMKEGVQIGTKAFEAIVTSNPLKMLGDLSLTGTNPDDAAKLQQEQFEKQFAKAKASDSPAELHNMVAENLKAQEETTRLIAAKTAAMAEAVKRMQQSA